MRFDHLAYVVRDTERSVEEFRSFFPRVTFSRKAHEPQGAFITLMSVAAGDVTIELVEPFENNRLLTNRLDREKQECVPYHICFEVDNFAAEYNRMRQLGWIVLTRPFDTFTAGIQASHLYKPAAGIIEIVGAKPL